MQALGHQIRSLINSKAGVEITGSVVIEELAHLFGEGAVDHNGEPGSEKTPEKYTYEVVRQTAKRPSSTNHRGTGAEGTGFHQPNSESSSNKPGNSNNGQKSGENKGGQSERRRRILLEDVRNKIVDDGTALFTSRKLYFTAPTSGQIELSIQALGINDPEPLVIVDAHPVKSVDGVVVLDVEAGERQELTVYLDESYSGPIEIIAVPVVDIEVTQ